MAGKRGHKQEDIIHAGWRLMQKYGVRRVTIEEVCRAADVSKMTFYKYFENKMELVKRMIHFYAEVNLREFHETMAMDISFNEKMERTIYLKLAKSKEISAEFIQDIYRSDDEEMRTFIEEFYKESTDKGVKELIDAQQRGEMRQDFDPVLLVVVFDALKAMISDERLLKAYPDKHTMLEKISKFFVYGVSNHE